MTLVCVKGDKSLDKNSKHTITMSNNNITATKSIWYYRLYKGPLDCLKALY